MSESSSLELNGGQLQDFTIDQLAGASALILGSIGGLLMIIWKSRCLCKCRLGCSDKSYVFDCVREPPKNEDSEDDEENNKKKNKDKNKDKKTIKPNKPIDRTSKEKEPEPEPEPEISP